MTRKKLPVTLETEEAQNLLKQPSKRYPTGLRNKAMMSVMLNCGLRVSEVVNLRPGNINLTKGKLRVDMVKKPESQKPFPPTPCGTHTLPNTTAKPKTSKPSAASLATPISALLQFTLP